MISATPGEIIELRRDLHRHALETEQAEQAILRKAQEHLNQLSDTPCSETERRLLHGVIRRAEATLGLKSQTK
ncbi:hypothetical protein GXB82_08600 [Pseudomonas stutzeri]|nr:hypothetical protein [Stutzerimonas stutzeri]